MRFLVLLAAIGLCGCATIDKAEKTVCANKAEVIGAAQAVIDALNAQCPIEVRNGDWDYA